MSVFRDHRGTGIRYYAYAFEAAQTERARADPSSVIGEDPLADAWGLEPCSTGGATDFRQVVPERDLLYLDKAWSSLQYLTVGPDGSPSGARPAHRMFEGAVRWTDYGWEGWTRAITPCEAASILPDLRDLLEAYEPMPSETEDPSEDGDESRSDYVGPYLARAHEFVAGVVADGRGFVYLIG